MYHSVVLYVHIFLNHQVSITNFCSGHLSNARKSTYFLFPKEQIKSFVTWMFILIFQITCRFNVAITTKTVAILKECILHRNLRKNPSFGCMHQRDRKLNNTMPEPKDKNFWPLKTKGKGESDPIMCCSVCLHIYGPWDMPGVKERSSNLINSKSKSAFRSGITWEKNIPIEVTIAHFLILLIHQIFSKLGQYWMQGIQWWMRMVAACLKELAVSWVPPASELANTIECVCEMLLQG